MCQYPVQSCPVNPLLCAISDMFTMRDMDLVHLILAHTVDHKHITAVTVERERCGIRTVITGNDIHHNGTHGHIYHTNILITGNAESKRHRDEAGLQGEDRRAAGKVQVRVRVSKEKIAGSSGGGGWKHRGSEGLYAALGGTTRGCYQRGCTQHADG